MDFSVSQREAIISWPNTELTYNGTAQKPTATVSNIVGDDECIVTVSVEGEHTDASTSAYTATATALSNANYKLPTADEDKQTSFTIGKSPLTVKANNHTITYGETGANAGVTYTGFVNGETETTANLSGTLSYTYPKYTNGTLDGSYSVGSPVSDENTNYKITPSGLTSGNYSITCEDGTLTVVKKPVTVSGITASNKTYDGTTTATLNYDNATFTGKIEGDDLTVSTTGDFSDENCGTEKTVTFGRLTLGGTSVGNYMLAETGQQSTTTADINRKAVTVTPDTEQNKTYGEVDPTLTYTASGLVGSEALTGSLSREEGENVGDYAITQGTITDDNNGNYSITLTTGITFAINRKAVTVTPDDGQSKAYSETDPTLTYTTSGLVGSETLTGTLSREEGEDAGGYAITQGTITDDNNGNYSITFTTGKIFTIGTKTLTVTAEPKTITYGEAGANAGVTYSGFVNGETETTADLSGTLSFVYSSDTGGAYKAGDDVGNGYKIEPSGLTSNNYAIEFVAGTLTVKPMALTITANDQTIEFGTEIAKGTDQVTLSPDLFDDDDLTEITLTPSTEDFTDDGTATIMPDVAVIMRDGEDKTSNYTINYKPGILKTAKSVVGGVPYVTGLFYDASWKTSTVESVFLPLSYTTGSSTVELTKLLGVPKGKPVIFGNATEDPANPDLSDLFYLLSVPDASDDPTEVTAARILTDYNDAVEAMDKQHFAITDGTKTLRQVIEGALGETVPVSDAIVMTLTGGTFRSVYISDSDLDKLARNGLLLFILSKWEYMQVGKDSNPGGGSGLARRISIGDGKTNGIVSLPADNASTDDDWYTLDGRKVNQAPKAKGIYIRRGQKVVVR